MFPKVKPYKKTIYLDHAATTPLDNRVLKAMQPFWQKEFGNPSALYKLGQHAAAALNAARTAVAQALGVHNREIVFTAGGTESINLAILGAAKAARRQGKGRPHIITSAIEHQAALECVRALAQWGCNITYIPVDEFGFVKLEEIKKALKPETILISIMYANNEVGSIQPIAEIGKWLRGQNAERIRKRLEPVLFHTDACQAAGSLSLDVARLGVDLLSANGSKLYGPKQTGFLYVRSGVSLEPIVYGGGQERGFRSGTENVAGAIGLAKALSVAQSTRIKENKRLISLRDYFVDRLFKKVGDISLNGPGVKVDALRQKKINNLDASITRLPNNISITFNGVEGETLMLYLDSYNIAVATGSACATESNDPSHVLVALGASAKAARSTVRFTLGRSTTKAELDYVLKVLPGIVGELRRVQ